MQSPSVLLNRLADRCGVAIAEPAKWKTRQFRNHRAAQVAAKAGVHGVQPNHERSRQQGRAAERNQCAEHRRPESAPAGLPVEQAPSDFRQQNIGSQLHDGDECLHDARHPQLPTDRAEQFLAALGAPASRRLLGDGLGRGKRGFGSASSLLQFLCFAFLGQTHGLAPHPVGAVLDIWKRKAV
jgi:hypothetical protein